MTQFSDKIKTLKPSTIREILKVTADPTVISFAAGNPAPECFPTRQMEEISQKIFSQMPGTAFQYGISEGYAPLRESVKARMKRYGIGMDFDDCMIVSGGQQGIELSAKVLLNEGDCVICEQPSFIGALNAFRSFNINLVGAPLEQDGVDLNALESLIKSNKNVKLLYLIPTFQNPTGRTMSLEKRKAVLELADKYDLIILEDDPYFELRYSGEFVPSIKSLDKNGRVIYCGSFSKIIAPGIRVGYVCCQEDIFSKIVVAKQVSDVHTNLFYMIMVNEYLTNYDIDGDIAKTRAIYKEKRDTMAAAIDKFADGKLSYSLPEGGLFLWCELPEGYNGFELCKLAGAKKVAAVPGSSFGVDETQVSPALRLNFSLPSIELINKGIELLGGVVKEFVK